MNSEARTRYTWRHVFVANLTIRLRLYFFKNPLFYFCLVQNHLQHMCNTFGKSQADLIIVRREILKRFKQICDFSISAWQACYWSFGIYFHGASESEHSRFTQVSFEALLKRTKSFMPRPPSDFFLMRVVFCNFGGFLLPDKIKHYF